MGTKIQYGSTEVTKLVDDNGSTVSTETKYRAGIANKPVRTRYNVKVQIRNQKEEHEAYIDFSDELKTNSWMLDGSTKIEHSRFGDEQGFYYFVKSYTVLSYE